MLSGAKSCELLFLQLLLTSRGIAMDFRVGAGGSTGHLLPRAWGQGVGKPETFSKHAGRGHDPSTLQDEIHLDIFRTNRQTPRPRAQMMIKTPMTIPGRDPVDKPSLSTPISVDLVTSTAEVPIATGGVAVV